MRSISVALALLCAVAAGCKVGKAPATGAAPGIAQGTFQVVVQNTPPLAIRGGRVVSDPAGIDCGIGGQASGCAANFAVGTEVTLTATATGTDVSLTPPVPYQFVGWFGDCSGEGACKLTGNADKYVVVVFSGERTFHSNFTDGQKHAEAYAARATSGLDCYRCHGPALQGAGLAVGCSGCHVNPAGLEPVAHPSLAFTPAAPMTGLVAQTVTLSALATDPDGKPVTCTWSLARPPGSAAALSATSGTCSDTAGSSSFTPDVAGSYAVHVTASNQAAPLDATVLVTAQQYGGGTASLGSTAPDAELLAIGNKLAQAHAVNTWMTAANLAKSLLGLDAANPKGTYLLLDIRDPEDYARSHAAGAVNVPFSQLPAVLLANPSFPETGTPTKKVAILGYYGGDGIQASLLVNAARLGTATTLASGIRAWGVQFGQTSWSFDKAGAPCRYDDDLSVRKLELTPEPQATWPSTTNRSWLVKPPAGTTYTPPAATNAYPAIAAFTGTPTTAQKILLRAQQYLAWLEQDAAAKGLPRQERFQADWMRYDARVKAGDAPQILSFQSATGNGWLGGHAKGAILTTAGALGGLEAVATGANWTALRRIDPSREVWVHCFTGTSAAAPTMILGVLGYQARNLLYGNAGYTRDTTTGANAAIFDYDTTAFANDFPLASGTTPGCDLQNGAGACAAYVPARNGCKACHANYTAHFAEVTQKPIPGAVVEVASEGEG